MTHRSASSSRTRAAWSEIRALLRPWRGLIALIAGMAAEARDPLLMPGFREGVLSLALL